MPVFLFWNVAHQSITDLIAQVALVNEVDVLVLAECDLPPADLLLRLNRDVSDYQYARGFCKSLLFLTKFDAAFLSLMAESPYVSIRLLSLPAREQIIVVGAHLPSKLYVSAESQSFVCMELARMIEDQEAKVNHRRTIVLGDLNINPFEPGVISSGGLHAVTTRAIASRGARTVHGKSRTFFYNPMWKYFGDRNGDVPGTYYYDRSEPVNYFWNTFDQVLIRPDILDGLDEDGVRVLTRVGGISLID